MVTSPSPNDAANVEQHDQTNKHPAHRCRFHGPIVRKCKQWTGEPNEKAYGDKPKNGEHAAVVNQGNTKLFIASSLGGGAEIACGSSGWGISATWQGESAEHRAILNAAESGNARQAEHLLRKHITDFIDRVAFGLPGERTTETGDPKGAR